MIRRKPHRRASDRVRRRRDPRASRTVLALRIASALVMVVFLGAYAATIAIPFAYKLRGEQLLIVTSGSMAPRFQAGDAVVLHEVADLSDLKEGQIITFWPAHGGSMVTHRVVAMRKLPVLESDPQTGKMVQAYDPVTGEPLERPYVQTKGDANSVPDPDLTPVARVRGIVLEVKPHWGQILAWANSGQGRLVMLGPPLAIVVATEAITTISRVRRKNPADALVRKQREQVSDVLAA